MVDYPYLKARLWAASFVLALRREARFGAGRERFVP
jgi:hypothetical protein